MMSSKPTTATSSGTAPALAGEQHHRGERELVVGADEPVDLGAGRLGLAQPLHDASRPSVSSYCDPDRAGAPRPRACGPGRAGSRGSAPRRRARCRGRRRRRAGVRPWSSRCRVSSAELMKFSTCTASQPSMASRATSTVGVERDDLAHHRVADRVVGDDDAVDAAEDLAHRGLGVLRRVAHDDDDRLAVARPPSTRSPTAARSSRARAGPAARARASRATARRRLGRPAAGRTRGPPRPAAPAAGSSPTPGSSR